MSRSRATAVVRGHVGSKTLRYTQKKGTPVLGFSVAVNRLGQEKPDWHRCNIFGKLAETLNKTMTKGRFVECEGETQINEFEDQNGVRNRVSELRVTHFDYLDSHPESVKKAQEEESSEESSEDTEE